MTLAEKLMPTDHHQLIWPSKAIRKKVMDIAEGRAMDHLLLHGLPGTGKTTAANILADHYVQNAHVIAHIVKLSTLNTGVEAIKNLAQTVSLVGHRAVIINEVDNLSTEAQNRLRTVMDDAGDTARFFFTTNYLQNLNPAIVSRCFCVKWEYPRAAMMAFAKFANEQEGLGWQDTDLSEFVKRSGTDLRQLIRQM